LNLRNRLIWIAALTVAFSGVQLVASRRKAKQELVEHLADELMPFANECVRQAQLRSPSLRGALTLQVGVAPEGKLGTSVERVELSASSELQGRELVECIRERARTLTLKQPLPGGPEQLELTLPVELPASESKP
jgi:hypothetical protein